MAGDIISTDTDRQPGEPLLEPVMRDGRRIAPSPGLSDVRAHAARELERLPEPMRRMEPDAAYRVDVADALLGLTAEVDRRLEQMS